MTTPVSHGAIAAPYIPSQVQKNKLPQAEAGSALERAAHAGIEEALGRHGLSAALITDEKDKKSILDIVDNTFEKLVADSDKKFAEMNAKQAQRQGAIKDVFLIKSELEKYRNANPTKTGEIDLSNINVTLSESSPLYVDGKTTVKLSKLMAHYKEKHSELSLPDMPKTMDNLVYYKDQVNSAMKMVLEPASQTAYTELQKVVQERTAMWTLQSTIYRIIFDGYKKFNP